MNVFQYSAIEQQKFTQEMAGLGYKTFTTFFGDLSIAEWHGKESILDTYKTVVESWGSDYKYFTEFVMALNHKSFEHFDKNPGLSSLYADLYYEADDWVSEHFSKEGKEYYYRVTD